MDAESEQPKHSDRQPQDLDRASHERFGPLELLRTVKSDGRALLLFSRAAEERER
jgi:hypothetical protein